MRDLNFMDSLALKFIDGIEWNLKFGCIFTWNGADLILVHIVLEITLLFEIIDCFNTAV